MRIEVSGSHSTGKSTLVAAFVEKCPQYIYEPEAYELLADDIALTSAEGPDPEGLTALLEHTMSVLENHQPGASVIFERSPIDYLAYAAATQSIPASERSDFLRSHLPAVRASIYHLDLIVLLPVTTAVAPRPGEDESFRNRVDDELRRALIDDDYGLFEDSDAPLVFELPPSPDRQLAELIHIETTA